MLSRNAELRQSSQFLLPANLGKLSSRQIWVLCAHVPGRQSHNVDLISVCLKHRQCAVRHRIIVRVRTDEQDCFPGPFVHRDFGFFSALLGMGQRREQKDKTNKEHQLHRNSPMSWLIPSFNVIRESALVGARRLEISRGKYNAGASDSALYSDGNYNYGKNGGGGGGAEYLAVWKTRKLLIFRDAQNAENGQIPPNWNVSGT